MSEVTIKVRENGPFLVTGPATIVDHLGNQFVTAAGANVALCRCGQSQKKPFCDGSHKTCGFIAGQLAPPPESAGAGGASPLVQL